MSLIPTRLQNWRINSPNFDRNMVRMGEYGALDFFVQQTNAPDGILNDRLKKEAFASMGNTVQIPVIDFDGDITISNSRSCVIEDAENTSALYTVVFKTYAGGFTMVPALYSNNEIDYDRDFNRKMAKTIRVFADALDVDAIATLEANKTQVFADQLQYTVTGNTIEVPIQMATEILGDLNPIMRANGHGGQIHIVGNAGIDSLVNKLAQHGLYNDVNKQLEYAGKVFHFTNNAVNGKDVNGTFYAIADGNVGILTRVDREAYRRAAAAGHEFDQAYIPELGITVGTHYYTSVGDQSSIAGDASADLTCAVKEYFGFSVDVAFIVAYNSDPENIPGPIIKGEIAAPATDTPIAMPVYVTNAGDFA